MTGTTRYHLDTEGWDTVVEMINYCLTSIEGGDPEEDEIIEVSEFEERVRQLAQRMGLKKEEYTRFEFELKEKK